AALCFWIPACGGNIAVGFCFSVKFLLRCVLDSSFAGNDAVGVSVFSDRFLWFSMDSIIPDKFP
ncbi:hypothetical protein, partial [Neisseria meningitidis]|uniref:hypothetical protein n=1 Tax=Neisseria meningitidis TaxID=487 RepID=UPI001E301D08